MKNDIIPPKSARQQPVREVKPQFPAINSMPPEALVKPVLPEVAPVSDPGPEKRSRSPLKLAVLSIIALLLLAVITMAVWYGMALRPVDAKVTNRERIEIKPGSSLATISDLLEDKQLIRNRLAFTIYARLSGAGARLQAGIYSLSRSESSPAIIKHFMSGNVDQVSITFFPGATLRHLPGETTDKRTDSESVLLNAGYSQAEINEAFSKQYDHPLFTDKPSWADLEGYIYGETYKLGSGSSVEEVLKGTFDEYYKVIKENNLTAGFKAQGLNLYQGITLASIIQREVMMPSDQKQVAQVFLARLKRGMSLGSDVTYQYAAKKEGIPPSPSLDSPYNTRKVTGLPPGPISTPGLSALQAVASPASGDFLFFLSGDDGKTYFARTSAEHEANIRNHCQENCKGA